MNVNKPVMYHFFPFNTNSSFFISMEAEILLASDEASCSLLIVCLIYLYI